MFGTLAVNQIVVSRRALQSWRADLPIKRNPRCDRHTGLGIVDGGLQYGMQPQPPFGFSQMAERINGTGNGHGVWRVQGYSIQPLGAQPIRIGRCRRATRAVQSTDLIFACAIEQNKAITADTGHLRLANAQQHGTCNRCVHCVSTFGEDVQGNLRGQWVRRGAHAFGCENFGPTRSVKIPHGFVFPF